MNYYKKILFYYHTKLDNKKTFFKIAIGGLVGGILQGIIGLGSGNVVILILLN